MPWTVIGREGPTVPDAMMIIVNLMMDGYAHIG
jgi:hypothetical protein